MKTSLLRLVIKLSAWTQRWAAARLVWKKESFQQYAVRRLKYLAEDIETQRVEVAETTDRIDERHKNDKQLIIKYRRIA